jgi:hypothetical protein
VVAEVTGQVASGSLVDAGNSVVDWNTLLGAVVGAGLVFLFTEVREYLQRRRERAGLLKLLDDEIGANSLFLQALAPAAVAARGPKAGLSSSLSREAWIECRVRVAQLVNRETFNALAAYYRELQQLREVDPPVAAAPPDVTRFVREVEEKLPELSRLEPLAIGALRKYLGPSRRDHAP